MFLNCKHCGVSVEKPSSRKTGNQTIVCKECKNDRVREWKKNNPDKVKAYYPNQIEWRKKNRDRVLKRERSARAANPERFREVSRNYYAANKEKRIQSVLKSRDKNILGFRRVDHAYRARKRAAQGEFTPQDIQFLMSTQKGKCVVCKCNISKRYCIDHINPLATGGTNDKYNLQLLCRSCNASKGKKHPIEFMQRRGFLL